MCGSTQTIAYSPRRLVALLASDANAAPPDAGPEGGAGGDASPQPPSGPSASAAWRNLKQPMPIGRKIRLTVRNTGIKIRTGQPCCGHPGEPGC